MKSRPSLAECEVGDGVWICDLIANPELPDGQSFSEDPENPTVSILSIPDHTARQFALEEMKNEEGSEFAWVRQS